MKLENTASQLLSKILSIFNIEDEKNLTDIMREVIKSLFLNKLPTTVRTNIILIEDRLSLKDLALECDKILRIQKHSSEQNNTNTDKYQMVINDTLSKLMNHVALLQTKIEDKSKTIPKYGINNRSNYQRPETNTYRNNQRTDQCNKVTGNISRQQTQKISWPQAEMDIRNVNTQESTEKCWYHVKFGKNAKFCAQPCKYYYKQHFL